MAVYTHISHERIAELLQDYSVGALRRAIGIAEGVENSNYLLECDDVNGAVTKYILTLYEKRVDAYDLPFFMGLMQHLADARINCPLPIARHDGAILSEVEGRKAAIISFLEGASRTVIRNEYVKELGAAMAMMHIAANNFTLQRSNALSQEGWRQLHERILSQAPDNNAFSYPHEEVTAELQALAQCWPSDLPTGVIHADLFPDNVFFIGDKLTGIIDFYFACNDILAYDLAICINAWCFDSPRELNVTRAKLLLSAYDKIRPLSDSEKAALPILCRGAALRFFLTRAHDALFHDNNAMVSPKDPMEYWHKLQFHQRVKSIAEYGV